MASCSSSSTGLRTRILVAACATRSTAPRSWATPSATDSRSLRRHHRVEEAGFSCRLRVEHVTGHGGVIEMRRREPVPGEDDGEPGQREPDPDLVEPQPVGPVCTDPGVGCHQEERARRKGMPGARDDDRCGEGEDPFGQGRAEPEEGDARRRVVRRASSGRSPPRNSPAAPSRARPFRRARPGRRPRGATRSMGMEKTLTLPSSMVTVLTRSERVYVTASVMAPPGGVGHL